MACLEASACIVEGTSFRHPLGEESHLDLTRDFQFALCLAFGFGLLRDGPAPDFGSMRQLIEAGQAKRVSIRILESREDSAPLRFARRRLENAPHGCSILHTWSEYLR